MGGAGWLGCFGRTELDYCRLNKAGWLGCFGRTELDYCRLNKAGWLGCFAVDITGLL